LARIGSVRLVSYKRVGRVCSLEVLRKTVEETESARKSEDKN